MKRKAKFKVGQVVMTLCIDKRAFRIAECAVSGFYDFKYREWDTYVWLREKELRPLTKREAGR